MILLQIKEGGGGNDETVIQLYLVKVRRLPNTASNSNSNWEFLNEYAVSNSNW